MIGNNIPRRLLPILFLGGWIGFGTSFAQPSISFAGQTFDFGPVANLGYPPAAFEFTNTGTAPLAILIVTKGDGINISYENKFIQPGEKGRILVLPDLNTLGPFREEISILTNASEKPEVITITGTVLSVQQCFPDQTNMDLRTVNVINSRTKEPVPGATLSFVHNMQNRIGGVTNHQGKLNRELPVGQYHLDIRAGGYHPYSSDFFLRRSVPALFYEIDPLESALPEPEITEVTPPEITAHDTITRKGEEETELPVDKFSANNLVFLVDVSLSMKAEDKLELLKSSVKNLVRVLRLIDNVAVISYAEEPRVLLRSVTGDEKDKINAVIDELTPGGITNGVKGLNSAYQLAERKFEPAGNNQIILATDGKFTGEAMSPYKFRQMITGYAEKGITISIIGFGVDEKAVEFMKEIASYGKGTYIHVTGEDNISDLLINEIKANSLIGR